MQEKLKKLLQELLISIDKLDIQAEEKKIAEIDKYLSRLDQKDAVDDQLKIRLKKLIRHYDKIVSLQKTGNDIKSIQETLDKNG